MDSLVRHTRCGHTFDRGHVTVVARYADCSVFNCPGCGAPIDDRPGVHLRDAAHHDYLLRRNCGVEARDGSVWKPPKRGGPAVCPNGHAMDEGLFECPACGTYRPSAYEYQS